jgi:hypothetical protein
MQAMPVTSTVALLSLALLDDVRTNSNVSNCFMSPKDAISNANDIKSGITCPWFPWVIQVQIVLFQSIVASHN